MTEEQTRIDILNSIEYQLDRLKYTSPGGYGAQSDYVKYAQSIRDLSEAYKNLKGE